MRLIDADTLKEDLTNMLDRMVKSIDNAPTVITNPIYEAYCAISDAEFEHSDSFWIRTPKGKKINFVKEKQIGEWIPISEQEPDIGGMYLVTAKHISGHVGIDIARRISDNVWTFGGEVLKDTEIIAWYTQPLPKPYKEVNENE